MKLNRWMTMVAVTGALASTPLLAAGTQGMQDQGMQDQSGMTNGGSMGRAGQDVSSANQQASADAVRKLQQALNDKGHNAGPVDGIIGPKTTAALRDFQQASGLEASGEIDADTLTALDIDRSEFAAFGVSDESGGKGTSGAMDEGGGMDSGSSMPRSDAPPAGSSGGQSGGGY